MAKTPSKKELTKKLSGLVTQAKDLQAEGKTSTGLENELARSESMVSQTKKQGSKAYAGSSFENDYLKSDAYKKSLMGTPLVSSKMGKDLVVGADATMNNLAPVTAMPTDPVSEGGQTQTSTTTATTDTTTTQPDNANDYITYLNEKTGQEMTLKGSALTEEAKADAVKKGYVEASSEISGVKTTPEMAKLKREVDSATRETDSFMARLESMLVSDKELRGEISQIRSKYTARQNEMREINERRQVAMETLGVRTGARYTGGSGGIMGGILSEEERQGLMRIESIENDKQDAILSAKKAARDQNFTLYTTLAAKAEKIQEKKATELQALKKAQAEQDAKIAEEKQQAEYDALIMEQLSTGETDPLKIVQSLSGKVPFDQIKALTDLMPKKEYQFVSGTENQAAGVFDKSTGKFTATGGGGGAGGGVGAGNPQAVYWAQLINQGKAKLENVPEKLRTAVVQELAGAEPTMSKANEQAYDQANTALTAIDDVLTGIKEAGIAERTLLSKLPGTLARDVENSIETVQALIGFDALAEMRAASPTGGALGSITEKELRYLQSVQGSLDPLQSTAKLEKTLTTIRKSFARIRAINSVGTTAEQYKKQFPDATEEELREISARQTTKSVQENATMSNKDLFGSGTWATSNTTTDGTDVFQLIGLEE